MTQENTKFTIDREKLTVTVERVFDAPLEMVWSAWTESRYLDQWWGPQPFHVETKSQDFRDGGVWLYAMVGPEGQKFWGSQHYSRINPRKHYSFRSLFCDENGVVSPGTTGSNWLNTFTEQNGVTLVTNEIRTDSIEHLEAQLQRGFKEGFSVGLDQLAELLARLTAKAK
jgi:PhnB protein